MARVVKGAAPLSREFGGRRMISDQHNDLTYLFPQPLAPAVITFDPAAMRADLDAMCRPCSPAELRAVLGSLRMRKAAGPDTVPNEMLVRLGPTQSSRGPPGRPRPSAPASRGWRAACRAPVKREV